ncbi:MAG: TPM domain-containing protein [Bacteroidales bacterium]|jgi:uncharacterized protein
MSNEGKTAKRKLSVFSELSALSAVVVGLLVLAALASLAFYIWMAIPPGKVYKIADHADLYTDEEEDELLSVMKSISRKKDINVMLVTTADKGPDYGQLSNSESARYAEDHFRELTGFETFRDNSGVLILHDTSNRYFYIATYGTARASITNSECVEITGMQGPLLKEGDNAEAVKRSLEAIKAHNFGSGLLLFTYTSFVIGPLLIVALVLWIMAHKKRTKITVNYKTYYDAKNSEILGDEDIFQRQKVSVTYHSSGSSGGFSSGGGGFSGGGGGGGGGGGFGGGGSHY